jgi:cysteine desulfuration protein SufE
MSDSFQKKCEDTKKIFTSLSTEEKYKTLMAMGKKLPSYPEALKTSERIVPGCQSLLYLSSTLQDGKLYFNAHTDALISAGLAALLISVYSGESPETILKEEPRFLQELGLASVLSLNRSNGLANIYLKIKKEALAALVNSSR